jgi:2-methylcitrate dehydratase PrpD
MGKGLLPTTNTTDTVHLGDRPVSITICDVGNPLVFVKAADLDMTGHETPSQINANTSLIHTLKELRGKACKIVGQCSDWTKVDEQSPFLPMVAVMSPAGSTDGHLSARLILDNRCHDSMAGTGAVCIAACSRIPGSVANQLLKSGALDQPVLQLEHQLGIIPVAITMAEESRDAGVPTFRSISFVRTARKIMTGQLHVPPEVQFPRRELDGMKHINGINGENKPQNITKALCEFVTAFKFEMLEPRMVNKIKELVLDQIGVAAGAARDAESSEPFLGAVVALQGSSVAGGSTVFTKGRTFLLQFAGFLNAAYVHTFDFDDTNAEAILHPGASVVPAVLAQGELANCDGQAHITAFAVAYEVSCRIGRGLGVGSYERGFHNTGTVGIFGAIAGIAKVKGLSTKQVEDAFGLAGSFASGSMQFLDNGSWNKRLHPALAVHNAFVAVAMAEAGVLGSSRPLEGKHGLFHSYSTSASLDRVTEKLGSEWAFASTAIKPFPACRMTHTSIEMVPELSELRKHTAVKRIRVELSPGCWNIVGVPAANKIHPQCIVDAQFSIYYQIAVCWLYGTGLQWKAYEKLSDEGVNALTDRIEAVANDDLITLEARIRVEWEDGHTAERSMVYSLGENENPLSKEGVHVKFLGLVEHVYGDKGSREIIKVLEDLENLAHAKDLMHLL